MIKVYERPTIEVEKFVCERGFFDSLNKEWDPTVQDGVSNGENDYWI